MTTAQGMTGVRVEIISSDAAAELRRAVLRPELPAGEPLPPFAPEGGVHLGAIDGQGRLVGTCVVFGAAYPSDPGRRNTWQLRAMATTPGRRGSGVGAAVLAAAAAQVRARGGELLWCNARASAIGFYERHGWVAEGPEFGAGPSGLPHRRMSRELLGASTSSQ